ncbi:MAG TPA: MgtC/SapB family protein [Ramlibacter sp.]|uniref:MgtC/SapB family protein n=1 Tax=Ramlibacter sp. TaxID=1917967 RepID=UPI002D7E7406|nr:MgtC/SapB family protein [Ramlibacter sp.]HET8747276.1 MgtC/SapB family protein [Ramlibacter sp.]
MSDAGGVVLRTLVEEFSDLDDLEQVTRLVARLVLAALLGGLLGLQRERHGKAAGVRTHMLVAASSALFVLVPLQMDMDDQAVSRVLQGLLAGIGFLCAGAILKLEREEQVHGLTTAAGVWMTAAIGVAAGLGREMTAVVSTLLVLGILALEGPMRRIGLRRGSASDADD